MPKIFAFALRNNRGKISRFFRGQMWLVTVKNIGLGIKAFSEYNLTGIIDVDVYSGSAHVTGIVAPQESKKKVLDLIFSVEGVKGIVDNLQVR
ncbi:MAG: hypothetical protein A2512_08090 [Deltaproteobacteria bacterium RIFOXYD12_FULL_56_24]|nr:MAG: hypothetical protein A2512_08090 [Deltaproteobacteria bacterium RIFOXYD12_FULL_56_24]